MFGGEFFVLILLQAPRTFLLSKSFVDALDATLARRVDWLQYLRRLLFHALETLFAALQAEQGTVGLGTHKFPLICFGFGRLCLAWPIYLALFCNSPIGPITFFCMASGLGLFGGLPTCIGDLFATKLRRVLGFAGFTASSSALGFGGI